MNNPDMVTAFIECNEGCVTTAQWEVLARQFQDRINSLNSELSQLQADKRRLDWFERKMERLNYERTNTTFIKM